MKKILYAVTALAVMTACGGNIKKAGADKSPTTTETASTHAHDDAAAVHDDHVHEAEIGHDHSAESPDEHAGHDHAAEVEAAAENPDEIVFTAAQAARTDFEVQTAETGIFREVIPASGQIVAAPGDEVTLVAPMAGIVAFADGQLAEGKQVKASSTMFHVSSKNIAAGDALARDASAYRKAKADFERAEKLLADKIVSQSEYDALKAVYEDAKAAYDALAGSVSAKGAGVKTHIAGYVTSINVNEGDYVETGQQLATVSQNHKLMLRAEVSQRYFDRLPSICGANFLLPYSDKVWALDDMGGRLLSVSRNVVPQTPLIPVTFEFDNNGQIMPGSYVDVRLLGNEQEGVLAIPVSAISEQQGLYYVYVQLDAECYMRREVKLGANDGSRVVVLAGLEPGEQIVTRGAVNLKMASASGAIPHGHEH